MDDLQTSIEQVAGTDVQVGRRPMTEPSIIDDVPPTWSDERMHVLDVDCWCEPIVGKNERGEVVRKHQPRDNAEDLSNFVQTVGGLHPASACGKDCSGCADVGRGRLVR